MTLINKLEPRAYKITKLTRQIRTRRKSYEKANIIKRKIQIIKNKYDKLD